MLILVANVYQSSSDYPPLLVYSSSSGDCLSSATLATSGMSNYYAGGSQAPMTIYAYCAPTTGSVTSVSMTLGGTGTPADWGLEAIELSWTGSTTPTLDAGGYLQTSSCGSSSCAGIAATLTGSTDYIIQSIISGYAKPTGISGGAGYTDFTTFDTTNKAGIAGAKNSTTGTAPSWTGIGGNSWANQTAIAFGFSPTACTDSALINWSGGTATNNPLVADLTAGTFGNEIGPPWGTSSSNNFWNTNTPTGLTYQTAAHLGVTNSVRLCNGGATYTSSSSTLGLQYSTSNSVSYAAFWLPQTYVATVTTLQCRFSTNLPNTDTGGYYDFCTILASGGSNFSNASLFNIGGGAGLAIQQETPAGTSSDYFPISSGSCYIVDVRYSGSTSDTNGMKLQLKNINCSTGALIGQVTSHLGQTEIHATDTVAANALYTTFGRTGGSGTPTSGYYINFGDIQVCYAATGTICPYPMSQ